MRVRRCGPNGPPRAVRRATPESPVRKSIMGLGLREGRRTFRPARVLNIAAEMAERGIK